MIAIASYGRTIAAHKIMAQCVCALLYQTQQEVYQELYRIGPMREWEESGGAR